MQSLYSVLLLCRAQIVAAAQPTKRERNQVKIKKGNVTSSITEVKNTEYHSEKLK